MNAVVVRKIGSAGMEDVCVPEPGEGEVLIESAVAGMCRTDLKIIEVGHRDLVLPRVPGEEVVGTVRSIGPGVDKGFLGRRVYVYPGTSCGRCKPCLQGAGNLCHEMQIMGFHRDGGFAEYVLAPAASTIRIPDGCAFDWAVAAEPLSCCINALELAGLRPGETIGIWGGGPAGAFLARAAAAMGAEPTVVEPDERRRAYHRRSLSDPAGLCFDVVIPAVGSAQAYAEAMAHLCPRGRLVVFSGLAGADAVRPVDLNSIHYREMMIVGAYGCSFRHGVQALDWISAGKVPVGDLISHRLPLDQIHQALDLVRTRAGMKILLYPGSGSDSYQGEAE
ncbi:MAG: alcohol dehydrogenase catalytic domain-containing protein [Verrucomicrobiae bacterium]